MPTRRTFIARALASLAAAAGLSRLAGGAGAAAAPEPAQPVPQPGDPPPSRLQVRCWHTNTAEYQPDGTYKVRVHYEAVDERGNVTPMGSKLLPEAPL